MDGKGDGGLWGKMAKLILRQKGRKKERWGANFLQFRKEFGLGHLSKLLGRAGRSEFNGGVINIIE